jgi:hypothetical protein
MMVQMNVDAILGAIGPAMTPPAAPTTPGMDFAALMTESTGQIAPGQIATGQMTAAVRPVEGNSDVPVETSAVQLDAASHDKADMAIHASLDALLPGVHVVDQGPARAVPAAVSVSDGGPIATAVAKSPRVKIDQLVTATDVPEKQPDAMGKATEPDAKLAPSIDAAALVPGQIADIPVALLAQPVHAEPRSMDAEQDMPASDLGGVKTILRSRNSGHPLLHLHPADLPVPQAAGDKAQQLIAPQVASATDIPAAPQLAELRQVAEPINTSAAPIASDNSGRIIAAAGRGEMAGDTGSPMPDRGASLFSAHVAALARDVVSMGTERDMRFNVRPEILGPVAVTIERREDGPTLRLSVETPMAVQAVRQAEPALNDAAARAGSPFVQVSVDLQSPGQRDRPTRAAPLMKRGRDDVTIPGIEQAAVTSGRFA